MSNVVLENVYYLGLKDIRLYEQCDLSVEHVLWLYNLFEAKTLVLVSCYMLERTQNESCV